MTLPSAATQALNQQLSDVFFDLTAVPTAVPSAAPATGSSSGFADSQASFAVPSAVVTSDPSRGNDSPADPTPTSTIPDPGNGAGASTTVSHQTIQADIAALIKLFVERFGGDEPHSSAAPATTVAASSGTDTVALVGPGAAPIEGGSGQLTFLYSGALTSVTGGSGSVTIYGGAGDTRAASGAAGDALIAASGNETLTSANSRGMDTLIGGNGQDALIAGIGGDLMQGGSGAMDFIFASGFTSAASRYVVTNTHAGDTVTLHGYSDAPGILSAGGNTVFNLSDGTRITFVGLGDARDLTIKT